MHCYPATFLLASPSSFPWGHWNCLSLLAPLPHGFCQFIVSTALITFCLYPTLSASLEFCFSLLPFLVFLVLLSNFSKEKILLFWSYCQEKQNDLSYEVWLMQNYAVSYSHFSCLDIIPGSISSSQIYGFFFFSLKHESLHLKQQVFIKKDETMPFAAMWMDLEIITLSEVSQTEQEKCHMTSLICWI